MLIKEEGLEKSSITAEMIKAVLEKQEVFIYEFKSKNQLIIEFAEGEYYPFGEIKHYTVAFGEYTPGAIEEDKDAWMGINSEYYPVKKMDDAINTFLSRLNSETPSNYHNIEWSKRYKLEDILVFNKQVLYYENHYSYLELMLEKFWKLVFNKTPDEMWCGGIIGAHGDKSSQYDYEWKKQGINRNRGALLFLLTYTQERGERPKHESCEWVIENYPKYLPLIEQAEKEILAEKFN